MNKHLKCMLKIPGALLLMASIPFFLVIFIFLMGLWIMTLPLVIAGCFEWDEDPPEWWADLVFDVFEGYKKL